MDVPVEAGLTALDDVNTTDDPVLPMQLGYVGVVRCGRPALTARLRRLCRPWIWKAATRRDTPDRIA